MKLLIITQNDFETIPKNIRILIEDHSIILEHIFIVNSKGSLINKLGLFYGFGFFQLFKLVIYSLKSLILSYIFLFNKKSKSYESFNSLKIRYPNLNIYKTSNIHSSKNLRLIKSISPDLIVSYSCPVKLHQNLLSIPKLGSINLHCSLLPKYGGLMPSFWTLFNEEIKTGVTVHLLDENIDTGGIINQKIVDISPNETITSLILKTKKIGGQLMLDTLKQIDKSKEKKIFSNPQDEQKRSYFSWPTSSDIKLFKQKGKKLI